MALARGFVLLALVALLAPCRTVEASGYTKLKKAIEQANTNAAACKNKANCLGATVTLKLNEDAFISKALPALGPYASLAVEGACTFRKGGSVCIVDGQNNFSVFTSLLSQGGPVAKLVLKNLIFQNAKDGVIAAVWATVDATDVVFRDNVGGAVVGANGQGGNPAQTYTNCEFLSNTGSAIVSGNGKYGSANGKYAFFVSNSLFEGNSGQDGGAVVISGFGTSVFENTKFIGNTAEGNGGAVYSDEVTAIQFRSVTFSNNTAKTGYGGAAYGSSGYYHGNQLNFCSCTFSGNTAPKNPSSNTLKTESFASHFFPYLTTAVFCNTAIPPGSDLQNKPYGQIITGDGGKCKAKYCSA